MKNPLWPEFSTEGGRTPHSPTSSDTISPYYPSCLYPSPDWLPFLDWNILNKHLPQDLQISCCLAKMHCPGMFMALVLLSLRSLFKYHLVLSPYLNIHEKSYSLLTFYIRPLFFFPSYHWPPSDTVYNFFWLIFCHQNGILGAFVFSTLHSLQWQYWDFVTIQFIFLRCMKIFFIKTWIQDILLKTLVVTQVC